MLRNVELCGYKVPTPIQKYCLPAISLGYDVIGIAQTGKYSLPFCHLFLATNLEQVPARRLHI
jgi:superfamily II DNA/RNA helicase